MRLPRSISISACAAAIVIVAPLVPPTWMGGGLMPTGSSDAGAGDGPDALTDR